jgi:hypothetical protein
MKYGFWLIFTADRHFSVKPKAAPLAFEPKLDIFQNLKQICVQHSNVEPIKNMGHMRLKFGFLANFCLEQMFFGKTKS